MKTFDMKAERRGDVGSRASRALRRSGRLPAVLCGKGTESTAVHVDAKDFEAARKAHARIVMLQLEGRTEPAVVHDVDWDVMSQQPAHVDFQRIDMNEKIEIEVALKLKGPAKGELAGGILLLQLDPVRVRCLPLDIPDAIDVDVRELDLHGTVHVRDLRFPQNVEAAEAPEALVLSIVEKREAEVAPAAAAAEGAAPAEPELIQKPKAEEEAPPAAGKEKKPEKK